MTPVETIRLDKWLWQARFFRSRGAAGRVCGAGGVRIDGVRTDKAHFAVRVGQVLTFSQGRMVRVVKVLALGTRRGPASEAARLYEDMSDEAPVPQIAPLGRRMAGAGKGR